MVPVLVATFVIMFGGAVLSVLGMARRRRRRPGSAQGDAPDWWPQFEREFRKYVRAREELRRWPNASTWRWNDWE